MAVRYIRTQTIANLFAPAVRAFGNIAMLGEATALAFSQSPGPSLIHGVRTAAGPDWATALTEASNLDAQFVVLANTPLNAGNTAAITALANHVTNVSNTGGDGKERMGVVMLENGATDPTIVAGALATDRMIYVAHRSAQDVGAAVAGT